MSLRVLVTSDYEQMSAAAGELIRKRISFLEKEKEEIVLGLATGNSPVGLYKWLAESSNRGRIDSARWRTFNLDEYVGLPGIGPDQGGLHPDSYRYFMVMNFFSLLEKKPRSTAVPWGNLIANDDLTRELKKYPGDWKLEGTASGRAVVLNESPESEYLAWIRSEVLNPYVKEIEDLGGVDLQILGVGGAGHVAFHESGIPFDVKGLLLVELDELTKQHAVEDGNFPSLEQSPHYALSMSVDLVFQARQVIVLANGARKTDVITRSLLEPPTDSIPMSYAQIYAERGGNIIFVLDATAGSGLLSLRDQLQDRNIELEDLRA